VIVHQKIFGQDFSTFDKVHTYINVERVNQAKLSDRIKFAHAKSKICNINTISPYSPARVNTQQLHCLRHSRVASYVRIDDWLDIVNNKERKEKKRVMINKVIRQVASELGFRQSIDREVR
jgi:hypothetical protein